MRFNGQSGERVILSARLGSESKGVAGAGRPSLLCKPVREHILSEQGPISGDAEAAVDGGSVCKG